MQLIREQYLSGSQARHLTKLGFICKYLRTTKLGIFWRVYVN